MNLVDTSNHKVVSIIQARMGSSRLPGKTLADIHGKPLLQRVIERASACHCLSEIVIATTQNGEDDAIEELCHQLGEPCFRGSQDDVLDRYYRCASLYAANIVVRLTADDPLKDPDLIDRVVNLLLQDPELDYVSNNLVATYPEGLDVEAFTFSALERCWKQATLASEREHVTPYIWKNPSLFHLAGVEHDTDLSGLRWTVDFENDLEFAREVYARLNHRGIFGMNDILALLQKEPQLQCLNDSIPRRLGYNKSLEQDRIVR